MKNKFSKNYEDLLEVYKNLHQKGTKWGNAEKTFEGRNVHLSIKTREEWGIIVNKNIKKYPNISPFIICAKGRQLFETIS